MEYRLLGAFKGLFEGVKYEHRRSHLGDFVASHLFEDLLELDRSKKLGERVRSARVAVNTANLAVGKAARRGDGTFGEVVPGVAAVVVPNFVVPRSRIASVEIGAETKILAKAMIKQIDRVITDLRTQVTHFRTSNPRAICVGIVGVNWADEYLSFEGRRRFPTDGKRYKHPSQEAADAEDRLRRLAADAFDEFVLLPFKATNKPPYPFEWKDVAELRVQYAAAIMRVSREYDVRF
ncbi:MAG TPA: hypothetical protein PKE29_03175 [Phycisphaerales bacterium]|nr:hypothetical protein [Phycisphaerales bacterium]